MEYGISVNGPWVGMPAESGGYTLAAGCLHQDSLSGAPYGFNKPPMHISGSS